MHKVTTINLNGKAYQLEEKGYSELHAYLDKAADKLADNPDKKEILTDLEQAIADKCDRLLKAGKDVVSGEQVTAILKEMGPVQAETDDKDDEEDQAEPTKGPRHLYIIPKGAMIVGVCNGIAAYIGVDVTIVRIIFVLLAFASGGFIAFLYLLLAFILPYAKTDEELAEAYGRRVTAQEIVEGAKGRAKDLEPALSNVSRILGKLVRILFGLVAGLSALFIGLLTAAWLTALWWISFGNLALSGQLASISHWFIAAGVTGAYFLFVLPALVIAKASQRVVRQQEATPLSRSVNLFTFALWFIALATCIVVASASAGRVKDYINTHNGYLDVAGHHICADRPVCDPNWDDGQGRDRKIIVPAPPLPSNY